MDTSRIARTVVVGIAGFAAVFTVTACGDMLTDTNSDDAVVNEPITAVRFANDAGNVTIRTGDETSVHREVHYNDEQPGKTHRVDGDVLVLDSCRERNCWIDYEVVVPAGTTVDGVVDAGEVDVSGVAEANLKSGAGDVTVKGVAGKVTLEVGSGTVNLDDIGAEAAVSSSSGDVNVTNVRAALTLQVQSGDVEAHGIGGATKVESSSGSVNVGLAAAQNVMVRAQSGDVTVTVPQDSYRVILTADSGDIESAVGNDDGGQHEVNVETSSGNITVEES